MGRINHQPQLVSRISSINSITGVFLVTSPLERPCGLWSFAHLWFESRTSRRMEAETISWVKTSDIFLFLVTHVFFFVRKKLAWCSPFFWFGEVVVLQTKRLFFFFFLIFCAWPWVFPQTCVRASSRQVFFRWVEEHIGFQWINVDLQDSLIFIWEFMEIPSPWILWVLHLNGAPLVDWFNLYLFFFLLDRSTNG